MKRAHDILVIDDEKVIAQAVVKICSAEGWITDAAESGKEGLHMCEHHSYRLIICDIMMTDIDGFQFLKELSQRKISTPVVMATGYSTVENAVKSLYCGAIDFIPKPFTADELTATVHRGLAHTALMEAAANGDSFVYVSCPAKYFRLGYISWVLVEHSGTVLVGVTDLFIKTLEGINRITLSSVDDEVVQGNNCAAVTAAGEAEHQVMCPVSGRILEVNLQVMSDPSVIEKDPFFNGWLFRILPTDLEYDLQHLISCSSDRL